MQHYPLPKTTISDMLQEAKDRCKKAVGGIVVIGEDPETGDLIYGNVNQKEAAEEIGSIIDAIAYQALELTASNRAFGNIFRSHQTEIWKTEREYLQAYIKERQKETERNEAEFPYHYDKEANV